MKEGEGRSLPQFPHHVIHSAACRTHWSLIEVEWDLNDFATVRGPQTEYSNVAGGAVLVNE